MAEVRADYKTRFKGKGIGVKNKQRPVSVMLPEEIDAIVRAMPNRSEFIRQAIIEKLERDRCA
ncbi:MAG: ribbon-helix-helix domain-containing protein [Cyanobacteriota bacterium]|nr:ribbon-helix-helix domain-containing protein [Cyanobacteriota bacterium]